MTDRTRRCECGERIAYLEDQLHADRPPTGRLVHIDADDQEADRGHVPVEATVNA